MQIDLSREDCEVLVEVLSSCISELRFEIGNTDDHDYRDRLKAREAAINRIIASLNQIA